MIRGRFSRSLSQARVRTHFTDQSRTLRLPVSPEELKQSPSYAAAKAGDYQAAADLVHEVLTQQFAQELQALVPPGTLFIFPHAEEASGRNAIPAMFAAACAELTGGEMETSIVQTSRSFHTGAGMMERMISGVDFDGEVLPGQEYALVDDNLTSGGTLADLGSYVTSHGGFVVAVAVLTVSAKFDSLSIDRKKTMKLVKERFGDVLENDLGIRPEALTDPELSYLRNFPDSDALRNRITAAGQEKADRLGSKTLPRFSPEPVTASALPGRYSRALTQSKDFSLSLKTEDVDFDRSPLPLEVIPNNMGINLCMVDSVDWTKKDDESLETITINFSPELLPPGADETPDLSQHARRKVPSVTDIMDARSFPSEEAAQKKADWANWGNGKRPWKAKASGRPGMWVVTQTYKHYDGGDLVTIYVAPPKSSVHQAAAQTISPVFHGTSSGDQPGFTQGDSFIWWTSNPLDALDYGPAKVFMASLVLKNSANLEDPKIRALLETGGVEDPDDLFYLTEQGPEVVRVLRAAGYDSFLTPREDLEATHYAVFSTNQIRGLTELTPEEAQETPYD